MVLVQDVKFLGEAERAPRRSARSARWWTRLRDAIAALKPRFRKKTLRVPLAMILFGMINWTFTWLRADGPLTYEDMAKVVTEIFLRRVGVRGRLPHKSGMMRASAGSRCAPPGDFATLPNATRRSGATNR